MATGTVRLHRVLKTAPENIRRAFPEPDAFAKWLPPFRITCRVDHLDARVGGTFRASCTKATTGHRHSFSDAYLELTPHETIRYFDGLDAPNLPGRMTVTISLRAVIGGTELEVIEDGIPAVIPEQMHYPGWREPLIQLAQLAEPAMAEE